MEPIELIKHYEATGMFTANDILEIRTNRELRSAICQHFFQHKNRPFAVDMLNTFIELRKDQTNEILIDDLMLCSYILGLHGKTEDCLLIWKAKNVDFDAHCGFDIQLIAFCGAEETMSYLQNSTSDDGKQAFEYVRDCYDAGDFDELEEYFDRENLPWWI